MTGPNLSGDNGRRVLILANPRAGPGRGRCLIEDLIAGLGSHRLHPTLCWERQELSEQVSAIGREEIRCIVAAGGDGTLQEVVNRVPGVPVTVLPLGNENLVARFAGISRSGWKLARIIAANHQRNVDLARANGRLFSLMASAGFDGAVVHRFHDRRPRRISRFSYTLPILRVLTDYAHPIIDVFIEESGERLRGALVFVFNIPQYAMNLPIAGEARADDGWLDLCVFERPGLWNLARYVTAVACGSHARLPDVQRRRVRKVELSSSVKVCLQTDGDPFGCLAATIEVVPGAMTMLVAPAWT